MKENSHLNQFNPYYARDSLLRMFSELSVEALEYVWRPIVYAYYWSDDRDKGILTADDYNRLTLISSAAHDSPEIVGELSARQEHLRREIR